MFVAGGLKADPVNAGWVLGWGVVRGAPWHLVGVYATKDMAETKRSQFDKEYEVHYGSHRLNSDDFIWHSPSGS